MSGIPVDFATFKAYINDTHTQPNESTFTHSEHISIWTVINSDTGHIMGGALYSKFPGDEQVTRSFIIYEAQ